MFFSCRSLILNLVKKNNCLRNISFSLIISFFSVSTGYIHYYARVTLKTYLPVKRIGKKFLKWPRHNNPYICQPWSDKEHIICILNKSISTAFAQMWSWKQCIWIFFIFRVNCAVHLTLKPSIIKQKCNLSTQFV